jgi:hypothetical protein
MIEQKKKDQERQEALDNQKRIDEELLLQEQQKKDRLKSSFDNEQFEKGDEVITIAFRLPNGSRKQRDFKKNAPVSRLYDFVSLIEEKGFENANSQFKLVAGFPAQPLEPNSSIKTQFPDSDQELVHVKEIEP